MIILLLALAACNDDPTGDRSVAFVQVTAAAAQVEAGDSVLLSAAPRLSDGTVRTDVPISWFSTDTSVARVEGRAGQKAMVVGRKQGAVRIRAMAQNKAGEAVLDVTSGGEEPPPAAMPVVTDITPASALEGSALLEVTVTGANFTELSLVRWNDVAIPTQFISATELRGLITPANLAQVGTAAVTVRTGPPGGGTSAGRPFNILSRVATVHVTIQENVLWVGESKQLVARPRDQAGNDLPMRATTWVSSDPHVMTVNGEGVVTPTGAGFAEIRATIDGRTGSEGVYAVTPPIYDVMYDSQRGNNGRELWILSPGVDPTPRRWLPEGFWGEDASTNPTGTRIAFVSRDQYLNTDIWVANRDGSGLTRLTTYEGADDQPTWSPDGSMIAFRSMRGGQSRIWVMNADGSNQRTPTPDSPNVLADRQGRPTFGPNGRIYFQVIGLMGPSVLASRPVDGPGEIEVHTPAGYSDIDPAVSWQGHSILVRRRNGASDLGIIYVDLQGNPLYSINYPGRGFTPSWGRNDQWITYSASDDGQLPGNIFITRANDFWRKRITIGVAEGGGKNPVFIKR
jgi:hypothetical protein